MDIKSSSTKTDSALLLTSACVVHAQAARHSRRHIEQAGRMLSVSIGHISNDRTFFVTCKSDITMHLPCASRTTVLLLLLLLFQVALPRCAQPASLGYQRQLP
jgi:hypothetical protein